MDAKEVADLFLQAVGKIEFYWNFYSGTVLVLIGWLIASRKQLTSRLKVFVTVGFMAFAVMNILGLSGSYEFADALRRDLIEFPDHNVPETHALLSDRDFIRQRSFGLKIHAVVDLFAIFTIWIAGTRPSSSDRDSEC